MILRSVKWGVMGLVGLGLVGGMLFGRDAVSYVKSSARGVRTAVKDSVPVEFELRRARDMVEEIIPEMHANIRLIAQEEVEVAALKGEIAKGQAALKDEENKIKTLRVALEQPRVEYSFAGRSYGRSEVKVVLASRVKLLDTREKSLAAAMQMLEKTKSQKRILEDRIEALAGQYRTLQAAATGSQFQVESSKLAQTQKLISDIQKRLDVAERVLAHESKFVEAIPVNEVDTVAETDLVAQVDDYFKTRTNEPTVATRVAPPATSN